MRIVPLFDEKIKEKLITDFSFHSCEKDLKDKHGNFAGVRETDEQILLLTDSISSVPLFYCIDRCPEDRGG